MRFIKEMIDGPDAEVLPRYVRLLEAEGNQWSVQKDKD